MGLQLPEGLTTYDLLKDQGSALGALATFLAVLAALGIGRRQSRDAQTVGDKQVAALHEQMRQLAEDQANEKKIRQKDLLHALSIEAARIKLLAEDRLVVALPQLGLSTSLSRDDRAEAFLIYTTDVMRNSAGISELPGSLLSPCTALIAAVDHLNSIIGVRARFGQLGWRALVDALRAIVPRADAILTQGALASEQVRLHAP